MSQQFGRQNARSSRCRGEKIKKFNLFYMGCRAEVVALHDWKAGEHLGIRGIGLHGCLPKIGACCILGKRWIFQADIINYDSNFTKGDGQNLNHQKEKDWRGASRATLLCCYVGNFQFGINREHLCNYIIF